MTRNQKCKPQVKEQGQWRIWEVVGDDTRLVSGVYMDKALIDQRVHELNCLLMRTHVAVLVGSDKEQQFQELLTKK